METYFLSFWVKVETKRVIKSIIQL